MASTTPKTEKQRVPIILTAEEAQELDDWQFENRFRTRTAALKAMMRIAIETSKGQAQPGKGKPQAELPLAGAAAKPGRRKPAAGA